jgi:hypothetical protein
MLWTEFGPVLSRLQFRLFTGCGRFPRLTSISIEVKNQWIFIFTFPTALYNVLPGERESFAFASALISSFTGNNALLILGYTYPGLEVFGEQTFV